MHPLDGIKVLDLTRVLAGPWCTQTLADLGAEVWKIEEVRAGDDTRTWTTPNIGGESTYFQCANRSKLSLAVDLKAPEGQALILKLAREADILVENFKLGALDRFGLGYEQLRQVNPALIYCSISGYGRTGPRAGEAGYDFAIQAESGIMALNGEPDGEPMKVGVAVSDIVTGMNATQAILAALIARSKSGMGQHLDISLYDSSVALLVNVASAYLATNKPPKRYGNAHATVVPYQIFKSSDGVVALAVGNDSQFRTLCEQAMGLPELAQDPRYQGAGNRALHRDTLIPALEAVFIQKPTMHWITLLQKLGVPIGQVRTVPEVFSAPETTDRGVVVEVPDPLHGSLKLIASPLRMSETPVRQPVTPPRLGEHSREVLHRVLGMDQKAIDDLVAKGVVKAQTVKA
jgi:crotonobetainyl-CoA:carnitine CoA-transferase CaiB-like acyl-CoA transferase